MSEIEPRLKRWLADDAALLPEGEEEAVMETAGRVDDNDVDDDRDVLVEDDEEPEEDDVEEEEEAVEEEGVRIPPVTSESSVLHRQERENKKRIMINTYALSTTR
jgi:hypothetical protein